MKALLVLIVSFGSLNAYALDLRFDVVIGDRETRFEVIQKKTDAQLEVWSNDLGKTRAPMSKKNYDYVVKRVGEIANLKGSSENCARQIAEVRIGEGRKAQRFSTCLNETDERAKALTGLLNLMATSI